MSAFSRAGSLPRSRSGKTVDQKKFDGELKSQVLKPESSANPLADEVQ